MSMAPPIGDLRHVASGLVVTIDLVGTFAFAVSGAAVGVRRRLDVFGVLVLAFVTATAGGMMRDVLIGATPPLALSDWRYLGVSLLAGLLVFWRLPSVDRFRNLVGVFDAAGLGLFAVSGAQRALDHGISPVMAMLLGMMTGIGGGIVRDLLVARTPVVLRSELYAVAALLGAGVVVLGPAIGASRAVAAGAGAVLCMALRLIAVRLH